MEETKRCNHCDRDLPRSQFYRDRKRKDGVTAYCKDYYAKYYADNAERQKEACRKASIKRRYDLTVKEYDALIAKGCSICGETGKRIVMDHCHASNAVRAPLCNNCNVGIGSFHDDPELLEAAAEYLRSHKAA
jgi:hypothetical protein